MAPWYWMILVPVRYCWVEEDNSYPLITNKSESLFFIVFYDKLNNPLCWTKVQSMNEEVHSFRPNSASCLQQRLRLGSYLQKYVINWPGVCGNYFQKDVAIRYRSHKNVQKIYFEILSNTFVPAFSGTPCIWATQLEIIFLRNIGLNHVRATSTVPGFCMAFTLNETSGVSNWFTIRRYVRLLYADTQKLARLSLAKWRKTTLRKTTSHALHNIWA